MATLTNWEADKGGYFQGTATIGQAIDWFIEHIRKLPKLPKIEINKGGHWRTWPEGELLTVDDKWLTQMIGEGRLPSRDQVTYGGTHAGTAVMRAMSGTHVIVEMLNTDRKTRHRCILLGSVLVATREGWDASLKEAS